MKYNPKFDVGQTVQVIGKDVSFVIKSIKTDFDDIKDKIYYSYSPNRGKRYYKEEDLMTDHPKPESIFDLKEGDNCYILDSSGYVCFYYYHDFLEDKNKVSQGNVFLTRKEAKKEAKRRKIHQKLKLLAHGHEFKSDSLNYYIFFDAIDYEIIIYSTMFEVYPHFIYFETEEEAKKAIREIGENTLIRDYFGIEK